MKLNGKTVLITGGTSGIGFEMAKQLLARNCAVIVTGRDRSRLDRARTALPGIKTYQADVSDPAAIEKLHGDVLNDVSSIDVLINNAGIMHKVDLTAPRSLEDVTREVETNFNGPVRMIQQFLPHLKTRDEALIVNVSSGLAFIPLSISPIYSATKAAIHSLSQSLRVQLQHTHVKVVELAPPVVETPLFREGFAEEAKGQKGMEVAVLVRHAIKGIHAGKVEIRPGLAGILHLMSRIAPDFMVRQLAKSMQPRH